MSQTQLQPGTQAYSLQGSQHGARSMASGILTTPSSVLTETEAHVLTLYDQVQQLQLQLALLRSQQSHPASSGQSLPYHIDLLLHHRVSISADWFLGAGASQVGEDDLAHDQTQLLEARSTLALRNSIVEGVVAVQPTLHAVYDAAHASPVEEYLHTYRLPTLKAGVT